MNQQTPKINQNLEKGLTYLLQNQEKNGGFSYLSSSFPKTFSQAKHYHNTFFNALILSCLNQIAKSSHSTNNPIPLNSSKLNATRKNIAKLLLSQKSPHYSWNYWLRHSNESQEMPYPDDLDDTFCALIAIHQYSPQLITGQALAAIISLLTSAETQVGGPYKTWLVDSKTPKIWQDVDLAVNSNIAYFLALNDITLPNLTLLIEKSIDQQSYHSPYYPTPYPIIYFIARSYTGSKRQQIIDYLLSSQQQHHRQKHCWQNPLNTALAISALLSLNYSTSKLKSSIKYLLNQQNKNHSWPAHAFCLDPTADSKKYYAGSSTLTTAFCLEALSKYQQTLCQPVTTEKAGQEKNQQIVAANSSHHQPASAFLQQTLANTSQLLSATPPTLKTRNLSLLNKFKKTKTVKQIILFPYSFYLSLGKKISSKKMDFLMNLGTANLLGWMAYIVYDDFLDDEGEPAMLSTANFCLRQLTIIFNQILPKKSGFHWQFDQIMQQIDNANAWEISFCRAQVNNQSKNQTITLSATLSSFPNLKQLANKSLGHLLGPVAILYSLGFDSQSMEIKQLLKFGQHYLVAKQLSDDAHDWEEDLKKGHLSCVVTALLQDYLANQPTSKKKTNVTLTLTSKKIMQLKSIFWHQTIKGICQQMLQHCQQARTALLKITAIKKPTTLLTFIEKIENSTHETLQERQQALEFIAAYHSQPPLH